MYKAIKLTALAVGTMAFAACAITPAPDDEAPPGSTDGPVASAHAAVAGAVDTTGYVRVPGGMLTDRSCTHRLPPGHSMGSDRVVRDAAGAPVQRIEPCAHPPVVTRPDLRVPGGEERRMQGGVVPDTDGWLSFSVQTIPSDATTWNEVLTRWKVPATPNDQSQTDFYFPGIEPSDFSVILQPVLQWGESSAGGGNYWAIASWQVFSDGTAYYTDLTQVSTGDTILGVIRLESAIPGFTTWLVFAEDENTGESQSGTYYGFESEALFANAFPAVHESYGDTECENGVEFFDIRINANVNSSTTTEVNVPYSPGTGCVTTGSPSCFFCPFVSGNTTTVF
jgi:hypothetical protein